MANKSSYAFWESSRPHWVRTGVLIAAGTLVFAVIAWVFPRTGEGADTSAGAQGGAGADSSAPIVTVSATPSGPNQAKLEGALGVANKTQGDTKYVAGVNGAHSDVIKAEAYYNNYSMDATNKQAHGVTIQLQQSGAAPEARINMRMQGDNTGLVESSVIVQIPEGSRLAYLPGSAVWRHNVGTADEAKWVETPISDDVMGEGYSVGDVLPMYEFAGTVTVQFRIESVD